MKIAKGVLKFGDCEEKFELEFNDSEVELLNVYVVDVQTLLQRSFVRSPENFRLSLKFDSLQSGDSRLSAEIGAFHEEHWAAFLHWFRPLAGLNNDKELYGFLRIRKLIERRAVQCRGLCSYLSYLLEEFQGKRLPFEMGFTISCKRYDLEDTFSLWMNAMEFHRDADKRIALSQMNELLPAEGIRALMANLALEKLRAMAGLRRLITLMFSPPGTNALLSLHSGNE